MNLKSILCVSLAVTLSLGNQSQDGVQTNGDASYEFGYDIHNPLSNDIKSHHEVRNGKNVVGFYTFKEADGSIRIVKYKVGPESGFEAVVEKIEPDGPLNGNSIDGQEAAPSTHGAPEAFTEPQGGHRSQYVAGVTRPVHGPHNIRGIHNPRGDVSEQQHAPVQHYANRRNPVQNQAQQPQHHHRNPYIIRRNPRLRNDYHQLPKVYDRPQENYAGQANHQRLPQETAYAPRGQRHQYNHRQVQEPIRPQRNSYPNHGQPQQYVEEQTQQIPRTKPQIVYINGIPYIDNAYIDDQGQIIDPNQVQDQEPTQEPKYEVREDENQVNEEAASNVENSDHDEKDHDKEEYEEEDDEDEEENAEYEEDDENEDEDADASEFYEQNDQLINEQQKEYDRLKKAYEEDGKEVKEKDKEGEEKPSEPVQEQK